MLWAGTSRASRVFGSIAEKFNLAAVFDLLPVERRRSTTYVVFLLWLFVGYVMGCRGSKHALHGGGRARAPEQRRRCSVLVERHSVALRSSTLGTLSLDRAAAAAMMVSSAGPGEDQEVMMMMKSGNDVGVSSGRYWPTTRSGVATGWCPAAAKKWQRRAPQTPTKTPMRDPEEINVWELMEGLEDDEGEREGVERRELSLPGSPVFDPDVLAAFQEALYELSPPPAPDAVKKDEIEMVAGVVPSPVNIFPQKIDAMLGKEAPPGPPPPPESTRRVVVYLTSLRGIRQTHEDCWAVSAILRSYGVRVDERDLSMHAGYKDELQAAFPDPPGRHGLRLPQVFVDGWYLGGAEEVRGMHESGELAEALEASCDVVAAPDTGGGKGGVLVTEPCCGCGGVRFMPCDECSGSCKVFVVDDGRGGAFKRCPECNENGLIRCPIC